MARSIDLSGKPICITGASAGIGRATALACARAGMPVFAAARREDRLKALVEQIRAEGGQAECATVDVASVESSERMIEVALNAFGSIYAVFANAGYGVERPMHEMTDESLNFRCQDCNGSVCRGNHDGVVGVAESAREMERKIKDGDALSMHAVAVAVSPMTEPAPPAVDAATSISLPTGA